MQRIEKSSKPPHCIALNHCSPIEDEILLLVPGVRDPHVGDHEPVDVGAHSVQLNVHLQRGAGLDGQLIVDKDICKITLVISVFKLYLNV